jgi:DNA-directed RNA polymerase specialized sigma24 family protein
VFVLIYYNGKTHDEAAEVLGVSKKTVDRRWRDARLTLREKIKGGTLRRELIGRIGD